MKSAVVIGAGLAGLAAAIKLGDQGYAVTLLERGARPGGRIRKLVPKDHTQGIDLGQHLMLGCYREAISLCRRLGTERSLVRVTGVTPFVSSGGRVHPYRLGRLPSPLHALPGLLGLTQLGMRERLGLARVVASAKWSVRTDPDGLDQKDAHSWLSACGQSSGAVTGFWEPLVLATLNTPVREASALLLATVLDKGFFNRRADAVPILSVGTLYDLFVAPSVAAIDSAGGRLICGQKVVGLSTGPMGGIAAAHTSVGKSYSGDCFVLAVPAWDILPITGERKELEAVGERARALSSSSIICVELWYDRHWLRYPYAAFVGSPLQWVFNHQDVRGGEGLRVSVVISSAEKWIRHDSRRLIDECASEIYDFFPESRAAKLEDGLVIRVPRATIRAGSGQRAIRPETETAFTNLFLAGDWTATGLPCTIEGAIMSGNRAARAASRRTRGKK